ncbi:uncharacterized protein LOC124822751, partial [Vigna umbellata]|uniref:uncharacterized protein LOC124822751 n=1 Tax=Vigna umbellata TaxID=87088 RepID=UPI001F5EBD00
MKNEVGEEEPSKHNRESWNVMLSKPRVQESSCIVMDDSREENGIVKGAHMKGIYVIFAGKEDEEKLAKGKAHGRITIKQIPKYAKFLKELCTHKRKMKGNERISMRRNVSPLIGKSVPHIPEKCKDPGPLQTTGVVIQLANRSVTHPTGFTKDVLVRVGELIFPANFYVLEMEEGFSHGSAPIILGRPFLKTARTKIDVYAGTLSMVFADIVVHFNILDAMKFPTEDHSLFKIDGLDDIIDEFVVDDFHSDIDVMHDIDDVIDISEMDIDLDCDEMSILPLPVHSLESECINHVAGSTLESDLQEPTLELKQLPDNLKYVYLEDDEKKPVIISTSLDSVQEEKLLGVLRKHKKAIGWSLADIP